MNRSFTAICCLLVGLGAALLPGCFRRASPVTPTKVAAPPNAIEIVFTYGSEKEEWINAVTEPFNAAGHQIGKGKPVFVRAIPMGSGESIDEIISGRRQVHLTSPASAAFIKLGNAEARAKTGKDLVASTENLVLSPVVIAMWKPMAEALGWGQKPVGWADVLALSRDPKGWAAHGRPEWGAFKLGHTHPEFSNSGLISLFAEVYAGAGKVSGLTLDDVKDPKVGAYLGDIEKAVVHYGSSTGFFGRKMFGNGPEYLSAAVLYENMVIESYSDKYKLPFPVVAVYPKEGTFWSDHPVGIVERDYVTADHREAAKIYVKYLLERPQQEKAMAFGFRPADVAIPLAAPLDPAHGIDPKEPKTTLEVPAPEVMNAVIQLWRQHKKHANIVLVFDISGSMNEQQRLPNAKAGALQMISLLGDEDRLSFLPFNNRLQWADKSVPLKEARAGVNRRIESLFASGGTALYDAIDGGYQYLVNNPAPDKISAVVVLTDGADTDSKLKLDSLLERIRFDPEKKAVRVFTIAYGSGAKKDILKKIADATQAKFYEGTTENIREVFKDISTFF